MIIDASLTCGILFDTALSTDLVCSYRRSEREEYIVSRFTPTTTSRYATLVVVIVALTLVSSVPVTAQDAPRASVLVNRAGFAGDFTS